MPEMPPENRKSQRPPVPTAPPFRGSIVLLVFTLLSLATLWVMGRSLDSAVIRYDEFKRYLREGRIELVSIGEGEINGRFKQGQIPPAEAEGDDGEARSERFRVFRVEDEGLIAELEERGVEYGGVKESDGSFFTFFLYAGLGLLLFMMLTGGLARAAGGGAGPAGALAFGKSKGKVFQENEVDVSFKDVAGIDEAKAELEEIIDFLKHPEKYGGLGAKIPKGVLLVGPPGTGKTLLARAVAGEASVPFISINGSEFVEMFVGVGASRVRDLFDQASKAAPCIVFIDELDAIGRTRNGAVMGGSNEEREQTLNQLLVELDGFEPHNAVIIMSATNRPEILDPALLRPGRFDRQILVDRPDRGGREEILRVHVKNVPLADDVDLGSIAAQTPGFAGADLANLVNEAALAAARRGAHEVAPQDFSKAIDRVVAGLERKSRIISEEERRRIAVHEIGHAIAMRCAGGGQKVQKISIIPHGMAALGYTRKTPEEERQLMTETMLRCELTGLLGGRAAELLVFGEASTGAANDLQEATRIARAMVVDYGMSHAVGPISLRTGPAAGFLGGIDPRIGDTHGNELTDRVDAEVRGLVEGAQHRAGAMLEHNRALLDSMASALVEKEQLEGEELATMMEQVQTPPESEAARPPKPRAV